MGASVQNRMMHACGTYHSTLRVSSAQLRLMAMAWLCSGTQCTVAALRGEHRCKRCKANVHAAGKDAAWKFPHAAHGGAGETMRGAAGRALDAALAPDAELQTWFVGRSPCMHHACPAGWTATGGGQGAGAAGGASTLFFHRAQLIRGVPALRAGSGLVEFVWLTKAELGTRLADADLVSQLQKAL